MKQFDVTALGEILIDFTESGQSENGMRLFEQNPGGAPANVLSAVAHLGGRAAFIGKVGRDMHGKFLRETVEKCGIDTRGLVDTDKGFTTLAFVALSGGERSFSFARKPGADTLLTPDEVDYGRISESRIFHIGSLSLTDEPVKSASLAALEFAQKEGVIISYDPNYRASLWESQEKAEREMQSILPYADVVKISEEETALITGHADPVEAAGGLICKGAAVALVTMGGEGAIVATKEGTMHIPAMGGKPVDTTGAGDAFMGGFLFKLAKSEKKPTDISLKAAEEFAKFAAKVAGVCISRRGAINAMPGLDEL
ncbi:MAG: carbohydrate kinase [Clostridia bacterium]|nr:carbohydrate kinase [Clostridia bacterium]